MLKFKKICPGKPGFQVLEKRGIMRTGGGRVHPESERNYCVQGKEELMLVIVERSE
jgi:hypothetical protein